MTQPDAAPPLDLEALEELCRRATPAHRWGTNLSGRQKPPEPVDCKDYGFDTWWFATSPAHLGDEGCKQAENDQRFMQVAIEAVPALIAVVRELREENERLRKHLDRREIKPCGICGVKVSWVFAGDGTYCEEVETDDLHECSEEAKERYRARLGAGEGKAI